MRPIVLALGAALGISAAPLDAAVPVTLRGSPESMVRQHGIAKQSDLVFAQTTAQIRSLEASGDLVRLDGNDDYEVADFVRYRLALPEMRTFIERLSAQYRAATGEKLVVTSLIRPADRQPRNSHTLSVHPTGMAVDLRVSQRAASRQWLENTLLSLERQGVLDVTRERSPPHYHIALFPTPYMAHVERLQAREAEAMLASMADAAMDVIALAGLAGNALRAVDGPAAASASLSAGSSLNAASEPSSPAARRSAVILLLATVLVLGWSFRGGLFGR